MFLIFLSKHLNDKGIKYLSILLYEPINGGVYYILNPLILFLHAPSDLRLLIIKTVWHCFIPLAPHFWKTNMILPQKYQHLLLY